MAYSSYLIIWSGSYVVLASVNVAKIDKYASNYIEQH